ncbi:MAG: tRNA guanosine(34) transglycosylase Tgt [Deltaproteobacteria bacterium]|nr:tRNA guanosine(34) transglycosylase Tgt [Deltaproteobacteria bacterium]MBW2362197.1 tRNA guanosine(34) transglycosylase Tgt [Deltaproteobacteria bacterium]
MRAGFAFRISARDGAARGGCLETPHGTIDTPAFMPVATYGAVRGLAPDELRAAGAQILLANTYHLHERPGEKTVEALGGLHGFTGWNGPWLTDSGGYQITSLAKRIEVREEGVAFRSPLDGRTRLLSPEAAMQIQQALGPDVAMVLDECVPMRSGASDGEAQARAAAERTLRWAERCFSAHTRPDQALFGIVQGGASEALRRESARGTAAIGFDGYAHGGLGLGEERTQRSELVARVHDELPAASPRYLMGLGRPVDLLDGIAAGVDLFDCVLPTRHARHGVLFTSQGLLRMRNARFRDDSAAPDADCDCPLCRGHSRAYLAHLLRSGEALGARLASLHNLRFYLRLLERARTAIAAGQLAPLRRELDAAFPESSG